jgi:predicted 2-oxoglutarate/Fe(II)-dependent dioxygenase YbiX
MQKESIAEDRIFLLRDFLTPDECAAFIEASEQQGYQAATVNTPAGPALITALRDNARVIVDDPALAAALWQRAKPLVPARIEDCEALCLNKRFRFYRYDPGQTFAPHYDGPFRRDNGQESRLTFMVYLNDDFTGGTTAFYEDDDTPMVSVRPEPGMALVFEHHLLHEGAPVQSGRKNVLRTDVMYAPARGGTV